MSISFKDALDNGLMSKEVLNILPHKCRCGNNIVLSDSLRELKCSSEKCINNVINRCINFCTALSIPLNVSDLYDIVNKLNIVTPYQLMMLVEVYEAGMLNGMDLPSIEESIQTIEKIKMNEYFINQIISFCGIPEISKITEKLFDGFNSIDEVFEEIESSRVIFVNEHLGIKSSDSTILSVEIYNKILNIKEELIFAESVFKVKKYDNVIHIAFADGIIGEFINKSELLEYLNYKYNMHFTHVSTITNSTDILIRSGNNTSSKIRVARAINEKFVAESINSGKMVLKDIGKVKAGELKPLGSKIYIDTFDNILSRLDEVALK